MLATSYIYSIEFFVFCVWKKIVDMIKLYADIESKLLTKDFKL